MNATLSGSFNFGATGVSLSTTSAIFTIQTMLRLRIEGAGSILLPSSAGVDVNFVLALAAVSLVLLTFAIGRRF